MWNRVTKYIICSIVFTRGANGATISEIRSDYEELVGTEFRVLKDDTEKIVNYLDELPGIRRCELPDGPYVWICDCYVDELEQRSSSTTKKGKVSPDEGVFTVSSCPDAEICENTAPAPTPTIQVQNSSSQSPQNHQVNNANITSNDGISERVDEQPRENTLCSVPIPIQGLSIHENFNVDRLIASPAPSENDYSRSDIDGIAYIGDDFLLSYVTKEFNISVDKNAYPLQFGHCVSGQTIGMALHQLKTNPDTFTHHAYIVNLGMMDILTGRDIYDIQVDYRELIETLAKNKILPICTTLPPLVLGSHDDAWRQIYQKLLLFNCFVRDNFSRQYPLIDLFMVFVNEKGKVVKLYYQSKTTIVISNSNVLKFVLWNSLGREKLRRYFAEALEE